MAVARVCVVLVFICSCVRAALLSKGMFCIDPDTGKLHIVNSTWPSTTFCGNYTCRIREKNTTEMEFSPSIPVVNITKLSDKDLQIRQNRTQYPNILITTKSENDIKPILHKYDNQIDENDRYLTESEIKAISEVLHTVKKSDLDAIVEIYNLAQELYKEMDRATSKDIIEDALGDQGSDDISDLKTAHNNRIKYWYEPINPDFLYKNQKKSNKEGAVKHTITQNTNPKKASHFKGTVSEHDFAKIPYHIHSNFQRASHLNPSDNYVNVKPCQHQQYSEMNKNLAPLQLLNNVLKPTRIDNPKIIQAPLVLPFPFSYMQHYAYKHPLGFYYNAIPSTNYDHQRRNRNYPQSYVAKSYPNQGRQDPRNKVKKPEQANLNDNKANLIQAIVKATKMGQEKGAKNEATWQTKPLSEDVLDEVRAHFEEKAKWLKGFSFAKGKLKRVGKVIKFDTLKRSKRQSDMTTNFGEYETYLVSTKCPFTTEPGFFKNGDLSRPYPECCPQRIDKKGLRP